MPNQDNQTSILTKLTALWALSESGLGGFMHALKIPFTGFFLGGFAIVIISLIAHHTQHKSKSILKATLLVILVKALVSPHSPPMAYIAVAFQGLSGMAMFKLIPNTRLASALFGLIALMESAIQKFLVMTLIFGQSLWEALDLFVKAILKDFSFITNFSFSFWLIALYTGVYSIWGLVVGIWAGGLPKQLYYKSDEVLFQLQNLNYTQHDILAYKKNKRKGKLIGAFFLLVFIVSVFAMQGLGGKAFYAIVRSLAALLLMFYVLNPALKWAIQKWANKQQHQHKQTLAQLVDLMPNLKNNLTPALKIAQMQHKGLKVYSAFVVNIIVLSIYRNS